MKQRKGLGIGMGMGYKNLVPLDSHIHSLSAKGVKSQKTKLYARFSTQIESELKLFFKNYKILEEIVWHPDYINIKLKGQGYYSSSFPLIEFNKIIGNDYDYRVIGNTINVYKKKRLDAKGKKSEQGFLEWDSREENFVVRDDSGNELDRWYPDDLVDQYIEENNIKCANGKWDEGEYVCLDEDGMEIDRIYAEELVKEVAHKQKKTLDYSLDAKGVPKIKDKMTLDEVEERYRYEFSEGMINTEDTPHYDSLNEFKYMLEDMGIIVLDAKKRKGWQKVIPKTAKKDVVGYNPREHRYYFYQTTDAKGWKKVKGEDTWTTKNKKIEIDGFQDRDYYFKKGKDLSFKYTAREYPYTSALNPKWAKKSRVIATGRDYDVLKNKVKMYMEKSK